MILALIRYYWQILKYGKPLPTQEYNPVYGKEELSLNQHWYGFTALGLVMGIVLSITLLAINSINQKEEFQRYKAQESIGCLGFNLYPPPPHQAHAKGELSLGTTPVRLVHFYIPKPAPWKDVVEEGIKKDIKVRDPEEDDKIKDWTCELHLPDSLDLQEVFRLPDFEFDVPVPDYSRYEGDVGEPELICGCLPKFPHEISFIEPKPERQVDEKPVPVNLDEVKKLIGYPQILQDAGIVGGHEIHVMISKEGIYDSHSTEVELHPIMTKQIDKHISKLVFTPAIRNGEPVAYHMKIPFNFCVIN